MTVITLAGRELEHQLRTYRRTWRGSVVSTVLVPFVYLTAMAYGLDRLVSERWTPTGGAADYLAFVGPGLLAATAMQVGVIEATYPIYGGATWHRHYFAVANTPLRPSDIFEGQLLFIAVRLTISSGAFVLALFAFGAVDSLLALAVLPAAVLVGMAFAAPVAAYTVTLRRDAPIGLLTRFVILPLFLFSGTFFPVDDLPGYLGAIARVTPLYQGVALCRELSYGDPAWGAVLLHTGYLLVLVAAGVHIGRKTFRARLYG
jgi:lipooligosaccharide transport system permease protein